MTYLVYHVAASEDGFIAGPEGELDWLQAIESPDEDYGHADFAAEIDGLVMGHAAYRVTRALAGDWPYGDRPCWVLSRSTATPGDAPAGVRFTREPPATLSRRWRLLGLKRVWLIGGSRTAQAFSDAGLIDEFLLMRVPVRLGRGVPPFAGAGHAPDPTGGMYYAGSTALPRGLRQERWTRKPA